MSVSSRIKVIVLRLSSSTTIAKKSTKENENKGRIVKKCCQVERIKERKLLLFIFEHNMATSPASSALLP